MSTDGAGAQKASVAYYPFGGTRASGGTLGTDRKFTGQRHDLTGLYFYGARYYDAGIGRFISPDIFVQETPGSAPASLALTVELAKLRAAGHPLAKAPTLIDPQALNRYSYTLNNPQKYVDPSGQFWDWITDIPFIVFDAVQLAINPSWENAGYLGTDVVLWLVPVVPAVAGVSARAAKAAAKATRLADAGENVSRIAARSDSLAFRNAQLTGDHFARHAKEFGYRTVEEYVASARRLAKRAEADASVLVKVRNNGDMLYYDPATNEFLIIAQDGVIRTYYKPGDRMKYWERQAGDLVTR